MRAILMTTVVACLTASNLSAQTLIEDFECVTWPCAGWVTISSGGSTSTAAAHDGARGFIGTGGWYRKVLGTPVGTPGSRLSMWVRSPSAGRTYMGFADTGAGCLSLVFGANTDNIIIQNNAGYGFVDIASAPFVETINTWYRLEVEFVSATSVTGRIYATDGTTVLQTVSSAVPAYVPGNVALRAFTTHHGDTMEVRSAGAPPPVVPAASTVTLALTFAAIAAAMGILIRRVA